MTAGHRFVTPHGWSRGAGFSHGVSARGRAVFVAGQVGWNPETLKFESDDFAAQAEQALRNVVAVLAAADASATDLVRLTWFVTSRETYTGAREALARAYRTVCGRHFPAMSVVVVAALLEERALVEIEATAVVRDEDG